MWITGTLEPGRVPPPSSSGAPGHVDDDTRAGARRCGMAGYSWAGGLRSRSSGPSKQKDAAWKLIEFLSRRQIQTRFYELSGDLPRGAKPGTTLLSPATSRRAPSARRPIASSLSPACPSGSRSRRRSRKTWRPRSAGARPVPASLARSTRTWTGSSRSAAGSSPDAARGAPWPLTRARALDAARDPRGLAVPARRLLTIGVFFALPIAAGFCSR
jgi:hypothetical protein